MSGIPEVEPIAIFPTRDVLNKYQEGINTYNDAMRQWLLDNEEFFRTALNATLVEVAEKEPRVVMLRESIAGEAYNVSINLTGYNPKSHGGGEGMISLHIGYRESHDGVFDMPAGHETGYYGNIEFEQLEILPDGLGLRLRRKVSDPRTITYIDALGNLTTETVSPLKS